MIKVKIIPELFLPVFMVFFLNFVLNNLMLPEKSFNPLLTWERLPLKIGFKIPKEFHQTSINYQIKLKRRIKGKQEKIVINGKELKHKINRGTFLVDPELIKEKNSLEIFGRGKVKYLRIIYTLKSLVYISRSSKIPKFKWHSDLSPNKRFWLYLILFLTVIFMFAYTPSKSLILGIIGFLLIILSLRFFSIAVLFNYFLLISVSLLLLIYLMLKSKFLIPKKLKIATIAFLVMLFAFNKMLRDKGDLNGFLYLRTKFTDVFRMIPKNSIYAKDFTSGERGYDTQFFYFLSYDPLLLRKYKWVRVFDFFGPFLRTKTVWTLKFLDNVRYRSGRIGYPILIKIFSFFSPFLAPSAMVFLILISHFFNVLILSLMAGENGVSPWYSLLYLILPPIWFSQWWLLPEPIALAFFLGGFYFFRKNKLFLSALLWGFSLLIRETLGLFLVLAVVYLIAKKKIKNALWIGVSFLPLAIWKLYLTIKLWFKFGFSNISYSPGDFSLPFKGLIKMASQSIAGSYRFKAFANASIIFSVLLIFMVALSFYLVFKKTDLINLALLGYSIMVASLNRKFLSCFYSPSYRERVGESTFSL